MTTTQAPSTTPAPQQHSGCRTHVGSDDDLVARCRTELPYDTRAFEALVQRYEAQVLGLCRGVLGDAEEAEDVTQDVFLSVYVGLSTFRGTCAFRHWLFRIARNACVSRQRKRLRRERLQGQYAAEVAAEAATLTPVPHNEIASGPVAAAFHQLSTPDRGILRLRHLDELSLRQLAHQLGISLSAAKMRLYRAERRFQSRYRPPAAAGA